ncbi:MAG: hypothetical protein IT385_10190 [Deltaproteobacteria bacterium]|nr:hypothetical protein [Deltaproteobacteria bacterium]
MRRLLVVGCLLAAACGDERVAVDATEPDGTEVVDIVADETEVAATEVDAAIVEVADVSNSAVSDIFAPDDTIDPAAPLGGDRPARVVLPEGYDPARAWPLVLLLHGYSASGELQDLYLGFSPVAAQQGFITIVPDGTTSPAGLRFWNTTPGWCCDFWDTGVDDAGYLVGLVAEAKRRWHVDPGRVYAFGHSNGGFMAHKLACAHAEVFSAIGSLAGSLPKAGADCEPARPVSVLAVHGTLDATIVYGGNADYPGAETVAARWASYDMCGVEPTVGEPLDHDRLVAGAETVPVTWSGCGAGTSVALWTMKGSGHVPTVGAGFVEAVLAWLEARRRQEEGP